MTDFGRLKLGLSLMVLNGTCMHEGMFRFVEIFASPRQRHQPKTFLVIVFPIHTTNYLR